MCAKPTLPPDNGGRYDLMTFSNHYKGNNRSYPSTEGLSSHGDLSGLGFYHIKLSRIGHHF